jgi:hypothetical protein
MRWLMLLRRFVSALALVDVEVDWELDWPLDELASLEEEAMGVGDRLLVVELSRMVLLLEVLL